MINGYLYGFTIHDTRYTRACLDIDIANRSYIYINIVIYIRAIANQPEGLAWTILRYIRVTKNVNYTICSVTCNKKP